MMLIDADKCPCFKCARTSNRPCPVWLCDSWCSWLQEIAYDVDKVVTDIEKFADCEDCRKRGTDKKFYYGQGCKACAFGKVIDIVRRGGIDEG